MSKRQAKFQKQIKQQYRKLNKNKEVKKENKRKKRKKFCSQKVKILLKKFIMEEMFLNLLEIIINRVPKYSIS